MSTQTTSSSGIGVFGLLGVVFVVLKLLGITEVATWSWWWVTMPFWGGLAVVAAIFVAVGIAYFGLSLYEHFSK